MAWLKTSNFNHHRLRLFSSTALVQEPVLAAASVLHFVSPTGERFYS